MLFAGKAGGQRLFFLALKVSSHRMIASMLAPWANWGSFFLRPLKVGPQLSNACLPAKQADRSSFLERTRHQSAVGNGVRAAIAGVLLQKVMMRPCISQEQESYSGSSLPIRPGQCERHTRISPVWHLNGRSPGGGLPRLGAVHAASITATVTPRNVLPKCDLSSMIEHSPIHRVCRRHPSNRRGRTHTSMGSRRPH